MNLGNTAATAAASRRGASRVVAVSLGDFNLTRSEVQDNPLAQSLVKHAFYVAANEGVVDSQGRLHQDLVLVDADRVPGVMLTPIHSDVRGFDGVHQAVQARISSTWEAHLANPPPVVMGGEPGAPEGLPPGFPSRPPGLLPMHPRPARPFRPPPALPRPMAPQAVAAEPEPEALPALPALPAPGAPASASPASPPPAPEPDAEPASTASPACPATAAASSRGVPPPPRGLKLTAPPAHVAAPASPASPEAPPPPRHAVPPPSPGLKPRREEAAAAQAVAGLEVAAPPAASAEAAPAAASKSGVPPPPPADDPVAGVKQAVAAQEGDAAAAAAASVAASGPSVLEAAEAAVAADAAAFFPSDWRGIPAHDSLERILADIPDADYDPQETLPSPHPDPPEAGAMVLPTGEDVVAELDRDAQEVAAEEDIATAIADALADEEEAVAREEGAASGADSSRVADDEPEEAPMQKKMRSAEAEAGPAEAAAAGASTPGTERRQVLRSRVLVQKQDASEKYSLVRSERERRWPKSTASSRRATVRLRTRRESSSVPRRPRMPAAPWLVRAAPARSGGATATSSTWSSTPSCSRGPGTTPSGIGPTRATGRGT